MQTPRSLAPFPAPPDIEPTQAENALARLRPLTFRPHGSAGEALLFLGQVMIGALRADDARAHYFAYRLSLPGLPASFSRPLPLKEAQDGIVRTVREWLESTGIPAYVRELERERASGRAGQ